ncbi:MAG: M28 family peptidase [Chloroflexi bacterium]|nr:M28 family peptidase [Chloroflexota bacterium]
MKYSRPASKKALSFLVILLLTAGCNLFSTTPVPGNTPVAVATNIPLLATVVLPPTTAPPATATQSLPPPPSITPLIKEAPSATPLPTTPTAIIPSATAAPLTFDSQRALEHIRMLAQEIGPRPAGTEPGHKATAYLVDQLQSYGLKVEQQEFTVPTFQDKGTTITLPGTPARNLDGGPLSYSPSVDIDAPVIEVPGVGSPDDYQRVDVKGKIALVSRGELPFRDKAQNARNAGAAVLLIYNNAPEVFNGTLAGPGPLPSLAISGKEGGILKSALRQGAVKLHITSTTVVEQRTATNVIATRPGQSANGQAAGQTIVLGAHYDSVDAAPGANDNGSGTATLLELARVLAHNAPGPNTLVFVAFDGEELGLLGSKHYVSQLSKEDTGQMQVMLNFDMFASGNTPLLLVGNPNLTDAAQKFVVGVPVKANSSDLSGASSDYAPFKEVGVPVLSIHRDYQYIHTPQDTLDRINPDLLAQVGNLALDMLKRYDFKKATG